MTVQTELRLSAQRAFLGRVHPQMRLIKVKLVDREIVVTVVLAEKPSDEIRDDVSCAAAEIVADFPQVNEIKERYEISSASMKSEDIIKEGWIYQRAE